MSADSGIIEGVLEFPRPLHLLGVHLGQAYSVRIGGHDCTLCLPSIPPSHPGDFLPFLASPVETFVDSGVMWGKVFGMPEGWSRVENAVIRVRQEVAPDRFAEDVERIVAAIRSGKAAWLSAMYGWLAALTKEPGYGLEPTERSGFTPNSISFMWRKGSNRPRDTSHGPIIVNVGQMEAATLDQWTIALDCASDARELAIEHQLLNGSRASLKRSEWRRSVLDAGTACEVAIATLVQRELARQSTPSLATYVLKKARGITELARLAQSMGVQLPTSLRTTLADPRNRAAHEGALLSQAEAKAAIGVAEHIVDLATPLT
jgi:hypothetical protein